MATKRGSLTSLLEKQPPSSRTHHLVPLHEDGLGTATDVPFILVRGAHPGPVLGISAAVHGDELNGIRIIHEVVDTLDLATLRGSLVCAPIANVPAFRQGTRRFRDGSDLNHAFPGKKTGRMAEQYALAFSRAFLPGLAGLIDVHTASGGRVNSFYARADLLDPTVRPVADAVNPDILLHVRGGDGTLRNAARRRGIPAVTVEAGNPRAFQRTMVDDGVRGVRNVMRVLGLMDGDQEIDNQTIVCAKSSWLYTTRGGLLDLRVRLAQRVEADAVLAVLRDPFGNVVDTLLAPHDGVIIGMARDPVAVPGTRYVHLGRIGDPAESSEEVDA